MAFQPLRFSVLALITLVIAALAFAQAASSVLTRKQPALAAQLFPLNGLALEQLASREFTGRVKAEADILPAAQTASPTALRAFSHDPLTPKAIAVMAFGQAEGAAKQGILDAAITLNRRDLLLQGLVLEGQVTRRDYAGTLKTLDSIISVHPEQKARFFPVLMQALSEDAALPAMAGLLQGGSDWHEDFLQSASRNPAIIPNLAKLRLSQGTVDAGIDRRLIDGLVDAGEVVQAQRIYRAAGGTDVTIAAEKTDLAWQSAFPPFDWKLADEAGFRAQLASSSTELDVFVRGGKGGALAERLIANPGAGFIVRIAHNLNPPDQVKDVRLQVRCPGDEQPFYDQSLSTRPNEYLVTGVSGRCAYLSIAIYARAWSGSSSIRGTISPIEISIAS